MAGIASAVPRCPARPPQARNLPMFLGGPTLTTAQILAIADQWRSWRACAAMDLWLYPTTHPQEAIQHGIAS